MSYRARLAHRTPFFYGWVIVGCAMLACLARQGAAVATLSVFVTPMSDEFGWSRTAMSGAVSLGGLLGGLLSPAIGPFVDRHGARAVLVLSSLIMAATCVALAGTQSLAWFYVAFGLGRLTFAAPYDIGLATPIANWFVRDRARAMALLSLSIGAGLAVMPMMAQLVSGAAGWRMGWVAIALVVLLAGALPSALLMIRRPEDVGLEPDGGAARASSRSATDGPAPQDERSFTLREAACTSAFWLLLTYTGLIFVVQSGVSLHQAPHFVHRGLDPTVAAGVISIWSLVSALSSLVFGHLGGRWPVRYGLALTAALTAAAAALTAFADSPGEAYFAAVIFGCGMGGLMTLSTLAFADYFGRVSFGAIRGAVVPVQALGQAAGPLASGVMFDVHGDYRRAFLAFAGVAALAGICALLARPVQPRQPR